MHNRLKRHKTAVRTITEIQECVAEYHKPIYLEYAKIASDTSNKKGLGKLASLLEAIMLVCFGLSWPINAIKAWKSETAASTSWAFLALITFGYIAGIAAKFVGGTVNWVLAVYIINLLALAVNWIVFFRNRVLDAKRGTN